MCSADLASGPEENVSETHTDDMCVVLPDLSSASDIVSCCFDLSLYLKQVRITGAE